MLEGQTKLLFIFDGNTESAEFYLYFWRWWCFGGRQVEMGTVTHFSCALIYPNETDLGSFSLIPMT